MSVDLTPIPDEILDEDEQESPRIEQVIEAFVRSAIAEVRVAVPGVATSDMDTNTNKVNVRPVMRDIFPDGTQLPEALPNVPIRYPSGSGGSVTVPILRGDPVVICISDRDIKRWIRTGNSTNHDVTATDRRRHAWSGAYVEPGLEPDQMKKAIAFLDRVRVGDTTTRLEIRNNGKVYLGTDTAEVVTQLSSLIQEIINEVASMNTFNLAVIAAATAASPPATPTPTPASNLAAIVAIASASTSQNTTLATITTNLNTIKTLIDQLKV